MSATTARLRVSRVGRVTGWLGHGALVGLAVSVGSWEQARAEPIAHCMTRLLTDVPAEEAHEEVKSAGGQFGPVTRIKVNRKTGRMVYCSGTSYCYWSNAMQFVTPCRIKRDNEAQDDSWFVYFTR